MAVKYDHLRAKAIELRTEKKMTLEEIVERLQVSYSTVYYWIKDIPIPRTAKQSEAQILRGEKNRQRHAAIRQQHYDAGWAEAESLLSTDLKVRDFVLLYIGEGSKRNRNEATICNSDAAILRLAKPIMEKYSAKKLYYQVQIHADHEEDEIKTFWATQFGVTPDEIKITRKSNSNELSRRQFRSVHGVCAVRTNDTYFRARLQAWMDFIKSTW